MSAFAAPPWGVRCSCGRMTSTSATDQGQFNRARGLAVTRFRALWVFLALASGALVYLLFRERGLVMFNCVDAAGLGAPVDAARARVAWLRESMPERVLFSFPDGCWAFAATLLFASVWRQRPGMGQVAWICAVLTSLSSAKAGRASGLSRAPSTLPISSPTSLGLRSGRHRARVVTRGAGAPPRGAHRRAIG